MTLEQAQVCFQETCTSMAPNGLVQEFVKMKLQDTLITADLVKFAKANPSKDENEQSFKDINLFVEDSYAYFQEEKKKKEEEAK